MLQLMQAHCRARKIATEGVSLSGQNECQTHAQAALMQMWLPHLAEAGCQDAALVQAPATQSRDIGRFSTCVALSQHMDSRSNTFDAAQQDTLR